MWVDGSADSGTRRIHVYDRGDRYTLTVLGENEPRESLLLDERGRGLLVRDGERGGVWYDLDDGRRLPLQLVQLGVEGPTVSFTSRGDALWWGDEQAGSLTLVPLADGLALERDADGSVVPLTEPDAIEWAVSSSDAPIVFAKTAEGGARFLRYPDDEHDALALVREAEVSDLVLPSGTPEPDVADSCSSASQCYTLVGIDPDGERVMAKPHSGSNVWVEVDRRVPELAGALALPEALASTSELQLLALLDRHVSVWIGPGFLYRWDRRTDRVDAEPLFATPPLFWYSVDRGRAVVLLSTSGVMYRVDREEIGILNLETTTCSSVGRPVVSPSGRWAAWTCRDDAVDSPTTSGVIVRVSATGIERHVGIAMATLAIDDAGDLLVYSVESTQPDVVDGVAFTNRPRSLFVLGHSGTISRIDEFEPAPAPIMMGEFATYVLSAALDG